MNSWKISYATQKLWGPNTEWGWDPLITGHYKCKTRAEKVFALFLLHKKRAFVSHWRKTNKQKQHQKHTSIKKIWTIPATRRKQQDRKINISDQNTAFISYDCKPYIRSSLKKNQSQLEFRGRRRRALKKRQSEKPSFLNWFESEPYVGWVFKVYWRKGDKWLTNAHQLGLLAEPHAKPSRCVCLSQAAERMGIFPYFLLHSFLLWAVDSRK